MLNEQALSAARASCCVPALLSPKAVGPVTITNDVNEVAL
jgi:hypothetical protein